MVIAVLEPVLLLIFLLEKFVGIAGELAGMFGFDVVQLLNGFLIILELCPRSEVARKEDGAYLEDAAELAKEVEQAVGAPFVQHLLIREKQTDSQINLPSAEI